MLLDAPDYLDLLAIEPDPQAFYGKSLDIVGILREYALPTRSSFEGCDFKSLGESVLLEAF